MWFVIHEVVLNFHHWILCYHEPFHSKIKRLKSVNFSMDLWHLNNMKVILTLNSELCWLCSFFILILSISLTISPMFKKHKQILNDFKFIGWYLNYVAFGEIRWLCAFNKKYTTQKLITKIQSKSISWY